ncbi:related to EMP47 Golgi membrane protein [Rhynchosporium graminicola]|uniref:Related to EMP47 Golgi membrane protein n=1 Tax=Rhynchosporium graminicola TaxID=2792576 RepID=A0A1E1LAG6_9HELO|nr:related to EMP47 Golgi membrane protein [Rhynchosporium commune]
MHFSTPLSLTFASFFFSYAHATYLHNELSFGHQNRLSPSPRALPNWHLLGKPNPPEILSNKLVLTPPTPGNQRAGLWSEKTLQHQYWTVDVDFRTTGPERAGGNLQMWYVKDGQNIVGTSSIYMVGKFDGLVLVVDQYSGSAGYIRGFLNDGNTDYASHRSVDGLAFGHCLYAYRNLGRPSRVAIQQSSTGFKVTVDGNNCFSSDKVNLPLGNYFGITAASADNPDSFEVFKFVTTTESHTPDGQASGQQQGSGSNTQAQSEAKQSKNVPVKHQRGGSVPLFSDIPDEAPSKYTSSSEQFADLHNRLQNMMKQISAATRDATHFSTENQKLTHQLSETLARIEGSVAELHSFRERLDEIQADVRSTKGDLHTQLDKHVADVKYEVRDTHTSLHDKLSARHGIWTIVLVVVGSQVVLVGAYLMYKKRSNGSHMKYL